MLFQIVRFPIIVVILHPPPRPLPLVFTMVGVREGGYQFACTSEVNSELFSIILKGIMRFFAAMSFLFLSWQIYAVEQCTDEDWGTKIQQGDHEVNCSGASYVSGLNANEVLGVMLKDAKYCKAETLFGVCVKQLRFCDVSMRACRRQK